LSDYCRRRVRIGDASGEEEFRQNQCNTFDS
jgi:hypothetical protein